MNHKFYFGSLPKTTLKTELSRRGKLERDTEGGNNAAEQERKERGILPNRLYVGFPSTVCLGIKQVGLSLPLWVLE